MAIPELVLKSHRIAAFLAAATPEGSPLFNDFCDIFSRCEFYRAMTPEVTKEAQVDLKLRLEFLNDIKGSNEFIFSQVLQQILQNLEALNAKGSE